jgi:ubiquinone/menaquinone biosynthesis C-methylase UbiE
MSTWNEEAAVFAAHWTEFTAPARHAVADALALEPGSRVLDAGCGAGRFCALAAERGAQASGIDGAPEMIAIASRTAPTADLCVGPLDRLPWPDATFDAVAGINSLQFADDPVAALREWARVTKPGGAIAICVWGPYEECELDTIETVLRDEPWPPRFYERMLDVIDDAGLTLRAHGPISVPYVAPDFETLLDAMLFEARGYDVPDAEARERLEPAAEPFKRPDGSYRLENQFRYAVSVKP